jgi:hypothetical protein
MLIRLLLAIAKLSKKGRVRETVGVIEALHAKQAALNKSKRVNYVGGGGRESLFRLLSHSYNRLIVLRAFSRTYARCHIGSGFLYIDDMAKAI